MSTNAQAAALASATLHAPQGSSAFVIRSADAILKWLNEQDRKAAS